MYSIIFSICCLNQVTYMLMQQFFCKIYTVNVHRKYSFFLLSLLIPLMTMLTLNISKFLILPGCTPFRSSSPISPSVLAFCTWSHIPYTGIYVTSPSMYVLVTSYFCAISISCLFSVQVF